MSARKFDSYSQMEFILPGVPLLFANKMRVRILALNGKDPETRAFLECYRELSRRAQIELAAFVCMLPGGPSSGSGLLYRLVEKGYL